MMVSCQPRSDWMLEEVDVKEALTERLESFLRERGVTKIILYLQHMHKI